MPLVQLGVLLVLLIAGIALVGRRVRASGAAHTVRLTQEHAVHLVELGGRSFVVGTGTGAAPRLLVELQGAPLPHGTMDAEGSGLGG